MNPNQTLGSDSGLRNWALWIRYRRKGWEYETDAFQFLESGVLIMWARRPLPFKSAGLRLLTFLIRDSPRTATVDDRLMFPACPANGRVRNAGNYHRPGVFLSDESFAANR